MDVRVGQLLGDAEDALTEDEFNAFVWIGIEQLRRVGEQLVVREAEGVTAEGES